jgi:CRP-like cAMP-binding protein
MIRSLICVNLDSLVRRSMVPMTPNLDARLIQGLVPRLRLFRDVPPANLSPLMKHCWVLAMARGAKVVERGTRLPGVLGLAYGLVKLSLRGPEGEERLLQLVAAGQTFGEAKALLGHAARSEAIALADSKLVVIPAAPLFALMDRDPRFARTMALALARQSIDLLGEVESAMRRSAQRLAFYLGSLPEAPGSNGARVVRLPVSKTLVAARLGVKKETLSRLLRQFTADGLIEVSRRDIAILDPAALERLTQAAGEAV